MALHFNKKVSSKIIWQECFYTYWLTSVWKWNWSAESCISENKLKAKLSLFKSRKSHFGEFCFCCMFKCRCSLSSIVRPLRTYPDTFRAFVGFGEHNFRGKIAMFNPPKFEIVKSILFIEKNNIRYCYQNVSIVE